LGDENVAVGLIISLLDDIDPDYAGARRVASSFKSVADYLAIGDYIDWREEGGMGKDISFRAFHELCEGLTDPRSIRVNILRCLYTTSELRGVNPSQKIAMIREQVALGSPHAMGVLGVFMMGGRYGVKLDKPTALRLLLKAAKNGFPYAVSWLDMYIHTGILTRRVWIETEKLIVDDARSGAIHSMLCSVSNRERFSPRDRAKYIKLLMNHSASHARRDLVVALYAENESGEIMT
jgi:TPR repeat protein